MPHLGGAHGLDELRGQDRIALNAFVDHEAGSNEAKPQGHEGDDQETGQREPTQQVELYRGCSDFLAAKVLSQTQGMAHGVILLMEGTATHGALRPASGDCT
ncbi:hypothetical protein D9M73_277670 [compost metagenome]